MTTTELGQCEWFVWDLRRSNLVDRGQLDQVVGDYLKRQPGAEPATLARFLVEQGILSPFQVERLLQGKTQGLVLGPYTLTEALGSGSMGTVYKALSKNDNQWYAIKVLPRRSMWNVRIARRQVRAFEQCDHPAVVPFVDVGTSGSTHYLVWPFVEGQTLEQLVQEQGKLSPGLAARYALQTGEGLDLCHRQELVHGLLKPSNIMIGHDQQVRILDFGIGTLLANTEGESLVDTMSTANTLTSGLDCASPESIMEPTQRTPAGDQYSLGCTLYFMLTGKYPFPDGTAVEKMMAHQTQKPKPISEVLPDVPAELIATVDRLMQKRPEDRYRSVFDAVEALRPLAAVCELLNVPAIRAVPKSPPFKKWNSQSEKAISEPALVGVNGLSSSRIGFGAAQPGQDSMRAAYGVSASQPGVATVTPESENDNFSHQNLPIPSQTLEERLGPVGLFIGAILAAGITWFLGYSVLK